MAVVIVIVIAIALVGRKVDNNSRYHFGKDMNNNRGKRFELDASNNRRASGRLWVSSFTLLHFFVELKPLLATGYQLIGFLKLALIVLEENVVEHVGQGVLVINNVVVVSFGGDGIVDLLLGKIFGEENRSIHIGLGMISNLFR